MAKKKDQSRSKSNPRDLPFVRFSRPCCWLLDVASSFDWLIALFATVIWNQHCRQLITKTKAILESNAFAIQADNNLGKLHVA